MRSPWTFALLAYLPAILVGCDPKPKEKPEPEPAVVIPKEAETLTPADIGVGKYVFEAKVPADKVMVLRRSSQEDRGKVKPQQETIMFTNGGVAREVVLVFDASDFPFVDNLPPGVRIRAQGMSSPFSKCRCTGTSLSPGRLSLTLTHPDGVIVVTYECRIEDYAVVKKRVPKLPEAKPHETWTYANSLIGD